MNRKELNALLFPNVSSARGAPMGRRSIDTGDYGRVKVRRVRMVDGDYDQGGAYWGGGVPLYLLWAWQIGAEGRDLGLYRFIRAPNAGALADAIRETILT